MDLSLKFKADLDQQVLVKKLNIMISELKKSLGYFGKGVKVLDEASIKSQFTAVNNQFKQMEAQGTKSKGALENLNRKLKATAKSGSMLGKVLMFTQVTQAVTEVSAAFEQFLGPYQEFDKQLKNIGTLGVKNFDEFRNAAIDLAAGVPDTVAGVTEGIYNAISAGAIQVVDGQADIANGMKFIEQASKLAVAGMTDTNSAIKGLAAVTNAYGVENLSAGNAADTLFAIVKNGVTTVPELNASLSNVVPIAAAAGISFDEVGAALATLTKQGVPTAQATTQMRAAIAELLKPGASLKKVMTEAGVSMETLQKEGLQVTMRKLGEAMAKSGTDAANTFSSIEAVGFALASTGDNASKFEADLQNIRLGAGSVEEAFAVANEGIAVQVQGVLNQVEAGFFKMFGALGDGATGMIALTNKLAPTVATFAGLGTLLPTDKLKDMGSSIVNKVLPSLSDLKNSTTGATVAQRAWNVAMSANPVFVVIAGVLALVATTKLLSSALHATAQEKLDEANADKELLKSQIDQNRQGRVLVQNKLDMVKAFESQGSAVMKNQELMVSLARAYPGVIDQSKSYEENLKALKIASEGTSGELSKLQDEMTDLANKSIEMDVKLARIEVDVAKEQIEDQLQEGLGNIFDDAQDWLFGTSDSRMLGEQIIKPYTKALYEAKDDASLQKASLDFQMAIFNDENFKELDKKQQADVIKSIKNMTDAKRKAIQTENRDLEKDLASMQSLGYNQNELVDLLSKKYGKSKEEVEQMLKAQKEGTNEVKSQEEAVAKLGDAWEAATKKVSDNIKSGLAGVNELALKLKDKNLTKEQRAELQKTYKENLDALKNEVKEKKNLEKIDELTQIRAGLKTVEGVAQYENAKKIFEQEKKRLASSLEEYEISSETKRLQEGREKSTIDEIALQNEKNKALEIEKQKLNEIFKLTLDSEGKVVDIGVSIGKNQNKAELIQELNNSISTINNSLTKNKNAELELRTKIKLSDQEIKDQIRQMNLEQLKYDIEIGLKSKSDLVEFLEEDFTVIKKMVLDKQSELDKLQDQMKATAGNESIENLALQDEINKTTKQLLELKNKELTSSRSIEQEKRSIREQSLNDLQEQHSKELEEIESQANATSDIMKIALSAVDAGLSKQVENSKNSKLKKLELQKEAELITEQSYNKQKEQIEADYQRQVRNIQETQRGAELEAERKQTEAILKEKADRVKQQLALLDPEKDKDKYQDLTKQLGDLETQLAEKGDLLTAYSSELQGNLGEIFANLLGGDNEALKESAKDMFAFVAGILKKAATATATKLILDQLALTPGGLLALVAAPAISAVVNVAISKILDPILSQITSFATGGRVDEPTLAIVGDASQARRGANTEWILRDDQLSLVISIAIAKYLKGFEVAMLPLINKMNLRDSRKELSNVSIDEFGKLVDNSNNQLQRISTSMNYMHRSIENLPKHLKENLTAEKLIRISIESIEVVGLENAYSKGDLSEEDYITRIAEKQKTIKSYAGGSGFLYQPELAYIGDAGPNNPEVVLNNPQLTELINRASSQSNAAVVAELSEVKRLLSELLQKDSDVYLDSRKVTDEVQREFNRRKFSR